MKRFHHFSRALVLAISYIMCTHYMLKGQAILIPYLDAEHHTHGYKDNKGNIMITAKYEDAGSFHEDMAAVKLNDKWGFINRHGMEIIPLEYDDPGKDDMFSYFFSDGMAAVLKKGKYGFITKTGKEIVPIKYDFVDPFDGGIGAVALNHKWGLVNKTGKEICLIKYDEALGGGWIKLNNKWALMDMAGKELTPFKYDNQNSFHEDIAVVEVKGKKGYINRWGVEITPVTYQEAYEFKEGLAGIKLDDKWGFIDKNGKEVISPQYDDIRIPFNNGKASVRKDGKILTINSPLINNQTANNDKILNTDTKTNSVSAPSVSLIKPPMPLKGKMDSAMVGLWKYTDASGRITYMKMNVDGTTESYINSVISANKSKGFCYWRIDGNFYESICDGGTSVNRYSFQKGYDKATGKPTLNLAGYIYIAADNKTSW